MSMDSLSAIDKQTFGAQVVSKTLDYMNGSSGISDYAPVDKQTFGAAVVSKTLDYMNAGGQGHSGSMGGMEQTYSFAKDVLGGYLSAKGALADASI